MSRLVYGSVWSLLYLVRHFYGRRVRFYAYSSRIFEQIFVLMTDALLAILYVLQGGKTKSGRKEAEKTAAGGC